jgi:DNA-binding response OmpR family regulator
MPKAADERVTGRVLIVDDEEKIVRFIQRMLELSDLDLDIRCTGTADEARRIAREYEPDLVILDIHLATSSETETADALIRALSTDDRKFLLISGDMDSLKRLDRLNEGSYLCKPFARDELVRKTAELLGVA